MFNSDEEFMDSLKKDDHYHFSVPFSYIKRRLGNDEYVDGTAIMEVDIDWNAAEHGYTASHYVPDMHLIDPNEGNGDEQSFWEEEKPRIPMLLLGAAIYSVGVNLFYKIVKEAASLIADYDEYDCAVWEAHHNTKVDSPSGTALEIARRIMAEMPSKTEVVSGNFEGKPKNNQIQVASTRVGYVPGTLTVFFDSNADTIELTHTARSREGLALGAVRACEWINSGISSGKLSKGSVYTMDDLLGGK